MASDMKNAVYAQGNNKFPCYLFFRGAIMSYLVLTVKKEHKTLEKAETPLLSDSQKRDIKKYFIFGFAAATIFILGMVI